MCFSTTATPGSPLAVALLSPPQDLSSPTGVSAVCAPCAASRRSTSCTGGHDDASASAPQPSLEATVLTAPPPVGSRRWRSPSPASRNTQPRTPGGAEAAWTLQSTPPGHPPLSVAPPPLAFPV
eukprot:996530-Pleurochrysis_carterae.AAC.1